MNVQSKEPAKLSSVKKKHVPLYKGKNYNATICENIDSKMSRNSDKNCQENENNDMQSVTKKIDVWLPKPTTITILCKDKNCQSTRCYKSPMRPMHEKNCQV